MRRPRPVAVVVSFVLLAVCGAAVARQGSSEHLVDLMLGDVTYQQAAAAITRGTAVRVELPAWLCSRHVIVLLRRQSAASAAIILAQTRGLYCYRADNGALVLAAHTLHPPAAVKDLGRPLRRALPVDIRRFLHMRVDEPGPNRWALTLTNPQSFFRQSEAVKDVIHRFCAEQPSQLHRGSKLPFGQLPDNVRSAIIYDMSTIAISRLSQLYNGTFTTMDMDVNKCEIYIERQQTLIVCEPSANNYGFGGSL